MPHFRSRCRRRPPDGRERQVTQWSTGAGGDGHYYEAFFTPNGIDWQRAETNAVSLRVTLAAITSQGENNFVFGVDVAEDPRV